MMKYVLGAGLLVALTAPGLAQSSTNAPQPKPVINPSGSTTTTTTTTEQYYVVRDPATKRCTTTTSKPTGCPAPLRPHHVTISASITDRSMTPAYQACPLRLEPHPQ